MHYLSAMDISPAQYFAIAADDPVSGISVTQSIEERFVDDEIARMVVSGFQNIRVVSTAEPA